MNSLEKNPQYLDFFNHLIEKSIPELVDIYNEESKKGNVWVRSRGVFLIALQNAFVRKNVGIDDLSGNEDGLSTFSLKYPVRYDDEENRLLQIS